MLPIADMDEIAEAGPIRRRIVVAWQCKRRTEPQRRIDGQWQQMCLRLVRFADLAADIGAGGIKISQRYRTQARGGGAGERGFDTGP